VSKSEQCVPCFSAGKVQGAPFNSHENPATVHPSQGPISNESYLTYFQGQSSRTK
jgi:hypothetical protein